MHVEVPAQVCGIRHAPSLSRDCRPHVQPFCVHVFNHQHFPFLLDVCPSEVPFQFARGKSPVFESVRGREARIDRCAAVGGLSKVVVLEVGDMLGGRTPRQQDRSSTLCHRDQDVELWLEIMGKFADFAAICIVRGTQPLLIGALFSVDHSCDNRVLGYSLVIRKLGEFGGEKIYVFWLPCL